MKNKKFVQAVLFFNLMVMSPALLASDDLHLGTPTFDELNIELRKVNKLYRAKKFEELSLIKDQFIATVDGFEKGLASGSVKLKHKYQKADLSLAQSYKKSFSTVWEALMEKYGHKPKPKQEEKIVSTIQTPKNTEEQLIEEFEAPESGEFKLSDLDSLPSSSTINPDDLMSEADKANEETLNKEVRGLDFKLIEYLMDNYYEDKYKKKLPPKAPDFLLTEEEKDKKFQSKPIEEKVKETTSAEIKQLSNEIRQKKLLSDKIKALKEEETAIISKEVEKVKIIRENQARFEIAKISEDEAIAPVAKPSRSKIVNTRDRLLDNDDDVIILRVPLN